MNRACSHNAASLLCCFSAALSSLQPSPAQVGAFPMGHGPSSAAPRSLGVAAHQELLQHTPVPWGAVLQEQAAPAWVPQGLWVLRHIQLLCHGVLCRLQQCLLCEGTPWAAGAPGAPPALSVSNCGACRDVAHIFLLFLLQLLCDVF